MRASDALKKTTPSSARESRLDRDSDLNKSDYDFGMEDDYSEFFESDDSTDTNIGMTDFNSTQSFGSPQFGYGSQQLGSMNFGFQPQMQQQTEAKKDFEEIASNVALAFLKGCWEFVKAFVSSFKGLKARFWTKLGANIMILGAIYILFSLILFVLKNNQSDNFFVAGILTEIVGVCLLTFLYDNAKEEDGIVKNNDLDTTDLFQNNNLDTDAMLDEEEEILLDDDLDEDLEEDLDDELLFEDEDVELFEVPVEPNLEHIDADKILENMEIPSRGMFTRQFLFDAIYPVLQHITPDYETFKDIDEDSDVFDALNDIVVKSAKLQCNNTDEIPYLIKASENLQFIKLDVKRTKGIKNLQIFCNEIANIFKFDEDKGIIPEENEGIYATGIAVGDKIIIKLFKGDGSMVSVKDIMAKCKDFFLDTGNKMPCIIGIDGDGITVVRDFKNIESMLITGFQRSGKTWFVLSLVTQLCMWNSPRDVQFVICDPKNTISDFKNFNLPHIREFVSEDADIVEKLRYIVRDESVRREKLIGGLDKVNIWDFKKANPDVDLPVLYVIIDEVITLADRMDKDTKAEFQGYIRELVTRMPALGVRVLMIPHVIKHDIINKTTTDTIQFRVSVKGDDMHIKNNLGISNFPHLLRRMGDMAVKLPDANCKFVRSAVLSDNNDTNQELFNFLRKLWMRIEPEYSSGSVAEKAEEEEKIKELLNSSKSDIDEFFDSEW